MKTDRDEKGLINSLRENSAGKIDAIKQQADYEINELNKRSVSDIEELRKKINDETSSKIDQELSKVKNRALIEKKKLRL